MIDKLTPRTLQTSKDFRAMGSTEMLDALNITVTGDEEGGAGVLKNIKGTNGVLVAHELAGFPEGENVVIGSAKDETLGVVYFFVWNENNNHSVFAYSSITNTYRLILQTSELNFDRNGFVKGDVIRVKTNPEEEAVVEVTQSTPQFDVGDDEVIIEVDTDPFGTGIPIQTPTLFNFCDYLTEENVIDGQFFGVASLIEPLTNLLQEQAGTNPTAVFPPFPEVPFNQVGADTTWYIQDILGNVYEITVLALPYEVLGTNLVGVNFGSLSVADVIQFNGIPVENFGCSYTPPPLTDVPDFDPGATDDEGGGLAEVDEAGGVGLSLDEGVSINLADSSLDLNEDGSVNSADLLTFLQSYGVTGDNLLGDFNQDGAVTNSDLLLLLAGYGLNVEDSD